jgi:hypothetical protein
VQRFRFVFLAVFTLSIVCHHHRGDELFYGRRFDHVRFSAGSALGDASGDTLLVRVLVTHESSHKQGLSHWACGTGPVAASAQRARRVWDSSASNRAPAPTYPDSTGQVVFIGTMCSTVVTILVPPGASAHFDRRIAVRDILGDSLSSGRYKITARLYINDQEVKGLPAGEVELR